MFRTIISGLIVAAVWSCSSDDEAFVPDLPEYISFPEVPADNQLTFSKVELGKRLFFEKALSRDSSVSCASCHIPRFSFADTSRVSRGFRGEQGFRNSTSLVNVVFQTSFFRDGGVFSLERAVHPPVMTEFEMNIDVALLINRIGSNRTYNDQFKKAFNSKPEYKYVVYALASYMRSLTDFSSPYDQFLAGDSTALSTSEKRGLYLFRSQKFNCISCHTEPLLMDDTWHNIGLYEIYEDYGRGRVTLDSSDYGKFRTPMLRNVAITAPYMHDGSLKTLEAVLDFYATGGKAHPNKSEAIRSFHMSQTEKSDLLAFLHALTCSK